MKPVAITGSIREIPPLLGIASSAGVELLCRARFDLELTIVRSRDGMVTEAIRYLEVELSLGSYREKQS